MSYRHGRARLGASPLIENPPSPDKTVSEHCNLPIYQDLLSIPPLPVQTLCFSAPDLK